MGILMSIAIMLGNIGLPNYNFDSTDVNEIVVENYKTPPIEWEITSVNGKVCCLYELNVMENSEITLLLDFGNYAEELKVGINPNNGIEYVKED